MIRDLSHSVFCTTDMFGTGHDDDNRAVVRAVPAAELRFAGLVLHGAAQRRRQDFQGRYAASMKAALYRSTGKAADVLHVEEIPRPEPGPGEVLVRVYASGVNPTDYKARSGAVPRPIDDFQIPHHDGAGVIEAVGPGVDPGRAGQRVWLYMAAAGRQWGTAAQCTVLPERHAVPLPDGASFELGASLGVPAMTAHYCLFCDGPVNGKTVLVAGGAGAVGHFAIELAKRAGGRVVTTVSSAEKAALAEKAGAEEVVGSPLAGCRGSDQGVSSRRTGSSKWRSARTSSSTWRWSGRTPRSSPTRPTPRTQRCQYGLA